jgi:hypothetical protein
VRLLGVQAATIDLESLRGALNALGSPYNQVTSPGRRRPNVPNHPGMDAILGRLQRARIVSKFDEKPNKSRFQVSKRYS